MKSKLTRIMGVALALVLVFSMGAAFLPVNTPMGPGEAQAGDLSWSTVGIPTVTGDILVGATEDVGPVAISPNFANDYTVFAAVNFDVASGGYAKVAKSTNGGHTWTNTTTDLGAVGGGDPIVAIAVSPDFANDNTVFCATQDIAAASAANNGKVYRSVNGGATFTQLGQPTLAVSEQIRYLDVSPGYDGVGVIAIAVANEAKGVVTTATMQVQLWGAGGVLNWTAFGGTLTGDCQAVKFSPNYPIDSTLLAVTSGLNGGTILHTRVGSNAWDGTIGGPVTIETAANGADEWGLAATNGIRYADIACPSDYNGTISTTRRAYVSLATDNVTALAAGFMDTYRVTNVTTPATNMTLPAGVQFANIEYSGDFSSGTLLGVPHATAAAVNAEVYRTTNPTSAVVNWYASSNRPAGISAAAGATGWIAMSPNYATDTTVIIGTDGDESAFGITKNGAVSFNETGLIGAGAPALLGDVQLSSGYATDSVMYLLTDWTGNGGGATSDSALWRRTNQCGGDYWDMVHWANFAGVAGDGVIALSNAYATDGVLYFADSGTTSVWYSGYYGDTWSARTIAAGIGVTVGTMAAPDATTLYVGNSASGTVAKSTYNGWTWPASFSKPSGATGSIQSIVAKGSTVVVGGAAGTVRRSDDGGATWSKISTTLTGAMFVDFDGGTVYATQAAGDLFRSVDGGGWETIGANAGGSVIGGGSIGLSLAADGTLYKLSNVVAASSQVYRSIAPTSDEPTPGVFFEAIPNTAAVAAAEFSVAEGSTGNIVTYAEAAVLRMYNDTLSASGLTPTPTSPTDGSTLATGVNAIFKVESLLSKVTNIQVQWDWAEAMNNGQAVVNIAAPALETAATATKEGRTIYWRARASAPILGPWSDKRTFETQVTTKVTATSPILQYPAGDDVMNVPLLPVFNWEGFTYATGYEFQLANDSGMTDLVVDLSGDSLGNTTSFVLTDPLSYSTTYYWRVRAVKGAATAYSNWCATVGFTTMAEPVAPTPPVIIEPTPAPVPVPVTTPSYIWAIISIGAVLVIVVIVLIVRTRRIA